MVEAVVAGGEELLGSPVVVDPRDFTPRGDDMFFRAVDSSTKIGFFVTDGTEAGTRLLAGGLGDFNDSTMPENLVPVGPFVYIAARRVGGGTELYRADGTLDGTVRVTDMAGGALEDMIYVGGELFFNLNKFPDGREPWVSNGTPAGTNLLLDIRSGNLGSNPLDFAPLGSSAVFSAYSDDEGPELWISDGTPAGTSLVADLEPGMFGSQPEDMFPALGKVFFHASVHPFGREPWVTDGTAAGTVMLGNIYPFFTTLPGGLDFTEAVGKVFFVIDDSVHGYEPWVTDGTPAGTQMLIDVNPSAGGFVPRLLGEYDGKMWFIAYDGADSQLWSTDGTPGGTVPVYTFEQLAANNIPRQPAVEFDGRFYFAGWSSAEGLEPWATDGTALGTGPVLDLNPGAASSSPEDFAVAGSLLYFSAVDSGGDREVWTLPADDLIFFDNLETGDASLWDNETLLGGTTSYNAAAADRGETGLEIGLDASNDRAFLTDETPDGEDFYRVRFRFNPNSITLAENKRFKIVSSRADTGERLFQTIVRWRMAEGFSIRAK
ncbi:MAG: hypothetical protein SX243_22625, partial [Acidobacteriota bacterium]|nr:hypothetical protein [Acidobacteriota bacterium]